MRVTVAIATLRRPERLAECLERLGRLDPLPDEVVVVDGDPARSAQDVVGSMSGGRIPLTYVAGPQGLTLQRNVALERARGDVVVFLDDDAWLEPDALRALLSAYADPAVVGATGRVDEVSSHRIGGQRSRLRRLGLGRQGTFTRCGYPRRIVDVMRPALVETMSGCFMSARLGVAREVRFDEKLAGYALAEDEDFAVRLSRRGRIAYVPAAVVHHDNSGFGGRDRRAFNKTVVVNRHYLFRKNFRPTPLARAEFTMLVVVLLVHRLLNGDLQGVAGLAEGARDVARGRGLD